MLSYDIEDDSILSHSCNDYVDEREDTRGEEMNNCSVHGTKDHSANENDSNVDDIEMDYSVYGNGQHNTGLVSKWK